MTDTPRYAYEHPDGCRRTEKDKKGRVLWVAPDGTTAHEHSVWDKGVKVREKGPQGNLFSRKE
jgi:hypothetical protein